MLEDTDKTHCNHFSLSTLPEKTQVQWVSYTVMCTSKKIPLYALQRLQQNTNHGWGEGSMWLGFAPWAPLAGLRLATGLSDTWAPPVGLLLCMVLVLTASSSAGLGTPMGLSWVRASVLLGLETGLWLAWGLGLP